MPTQTPSERTKKENQHESFLSKVYEAITPAQRHEIAEVLKTNQAKNKYAINQLLHK